MSTLLASPDPVRDRLLKLAHDISDGRQMAILGEGNVSARIDDARFLVKASGTRMSALRAEDLVEVRALPFLQAVQGTSEIGDAAMHELLLGCRVDLDAPKPSVESLFHAWLLRLPDVAFVGHVHPIAVNQILCSPRKEAFARRRLIPDQVVYCGAESVLVPYVDPGLTLAREIARRVDAFISRTGRRPKTILLENHGLIGLGSTHAEAAAALAMTEKAARIFVGAAVLGGPVFLPDDQVERIAGRPDEHYRQRVLRESS